MNERNTQQAELSNVLKTNGASLVGYGDISETNLHITHGFKTAISLAIHYDYEITNGLDVDKALFHKHLTSLNEPMMKLIALAEGSLLAWGYKYQSLAISFPIENNEQLNNLEQFPHKTAATRAGLGWIGKSALLITPEYGPRVKLCTILTNADFIKAIPINDNQCGNCTLCVDSCPCKAIKNVGWHVGVDREEIVDVYACNSFRLRFKSIIGRKSSCGLCIKACKYGYV